MKWQRRHKTPCIQIPTDVEQRSNQELLQEIEQLLEADAAEMDTDKLETYLDILQERAPVMEDYDAKAEWEKTKAQYPTLFTVEPPSKHSKKTEARRWFGSVRTVEVVIAAALCLMITANAFGYNPIRQFLDWADGIIRVYNNPSGEMTLPSDDPSEYHSLAEALEAYDIDPNSCPTWIPAEYAIDAVNVRDSKKILRISGIYLGERGELLIRVTSHKNDEYWANAVERDEGGRTYILGDREFFIVTNADRSKVGWIQGDCFYEINGLLTEQEIEEILKSIS